MTYGLKNKIVQEGWMIENEQKMRYQWASRTFTSTCLKLTMQNEKILKEFDKQEEYINKNKKKKEIQLYSFLENWYLHTMFNKSQKVLLGISDTKPCVILSMDDFMFTPPPILPTQSELYQREMNLIEMEECDEHDIFTNNNSDIISATGHSQHDSNFIDENTLMITDSSFIFGVIDENEDNNNNNNNNDDDDEEEGILSICNSDQLIITNDITNWDKSNENIGLHHKTIYVDSNKNQFTIHKQQSHAISWMQKIQYSIVFISRRLIETAYLISEVVESYTNGKTFNEVITITDPPIVTGKCIIFILKIYRVFFLGVEAVLNRFSNATPLADSHSILPKVINLF